MRLFSNSFEKGPGRSQSLVQGNLHHYVPVFSFKTLKLLREILLTIDFSVEPSRRKIYMGGYCITAKKETKLGRAGTFPSLVALIAKQVFIAWRREGTALRELRHQSSGRPYTDRRVAGLGVGGDKLCFSVLNFTLGSISSAQNTLLSVLPQWVPSCH